MNEIIKKIIKEKNNDALDTLEKEIKMARTILSGDFQYCEECNDYYCSKSFFEDYKIEKERVLACPSITNAMVKYTYEICPKGHRKFKSKKVEKYL